MQAPRRPFLKPKCIGDSLGPSAPEDARGVRMGQSILGKDALRDQVPLLKRQTCHIKYIDMSQPLSAWSKQTHLVFGLVIAQSVAM